MKKLKSKNWVGKHSIKETKKQLTKRVRKEEIPGLVSHVRVLWECAKKLKLKELRMNIGG